MIPNKNSRTVVFAPLDWGLGHASRCIPIIKKYKDENWRVIIASNGLALKFLQTEFPDLKTYLIPAKELKYSKYNFLIFHLFKLLPTFLKNIKIDREFLIKLLEKEKIELIVSDNRYGFYTSRVKSVLITHQLQLAIPSYLKWGRMLIQNKLNSWINKFDECWIMDNKNHILAGKLSNPKDLKIPYHYLGLQSRFIKQNAVEDIDFLIILSGLEPHRAILENRIIELFEDSTFDVKLIAGNFSAKKLDSCITYLPFVNTEELQDLLNRSKCVIARSGYSTIMDLIKLKKTAVLIPTPGQTEQEYLSILHQEKLNFTIVKKEITSTILYSCVKFSN